MDTDTVEVSHFADDAVSEPTVAELCENIRTGALHAVETGDYLAYAAVQDFALGDPSSFSSEEASILLSALHDSMVEYEQILYHVGWDLPELLLRYVDRFFSSDVESLPAQKPFRLVMNIFSFLCKKGSPSALFIRSCELMLTTEKESELNGARLKGLSLDAMGDKTQPVLGDNARRCDFDWKSGNSTLDAPNAEYDVGSEPTNDSNIAFSRYETKESSTAADNNYTLDDARQENVKFCVLFEVMQYSLQRISTPYPSRYLFEACQTLLQVANDPNADLVSVTTYARRMFLLARDFTICDESKVSAEELACVRSLLINFLTHSIEVLLLKYSLKFAERLYIQLKNKVAMAPPGDRALVYEESEDTQRVFEAISRMAQLLLSFDYEPDQDIPNATGIEYNPETDSFITGAPKPMSTKITYSALNDASNFWDRRLLQGASIPGIITIKSMMHFEGLREKRPNWKLMCAFCSFILENCPLTAGTKDSMLYWALWVSTHSEALVFDDESLLTKFLKHILRVISASPSHHEKFVAGSIVARALRFQRPEFSYDFCLGVMKNSRSNYEHFVVVETLKILITGKINDPKKAVDSVLCTHSSCVKLSDEQRHELVLTSQKAIIKFFKEDKTVPWYYLNFLSVVPTVPAIILEICDDLEAITTHCATEALSPSCAAQVSLLNQAISQLRAGALRQ